jgi:hypothetical protein
LCILNLFASFQTQQGHLVERLPETWWYYGRDQTKPFHMKKTTLYVSALLFTAFLMNCVSKDATSPPSPKEKAIATNKDEFGHYIKRGLTRNSEGLLPGYVLFCPSNSASVYLIDRNGMVVHEWKSNFGTHSPYLNDDGSITLMASDPDYPVFYGGGQMGRIQKINWDSKMLWDFEYATEKEHAHHDIAVKPNGNVLAIAWEALDAEEIINAGRKPVLTPDDGLWPTRIIEVSQLDKTHGEVVWEWHFMDHTIQDYKADAPNFGDVGAHPELLDFNLGDSLPPAISQDSLDARKALGRGHRNQTVGNRGSDVFHINAINYNPALEQIAISSYVLGEIYILDQSTSTVEASGHAGGRWGKGGDILYRWGNPANYRQGDSTDRRLFHQHDIRWIESGKPGAGNLTVYNNNIPLIPDSLYYSAIYELRPPKDAGGNYVRSENGRFGPDSPVWKYIAPDTLSFYGSFISGAERLVNGNTFINEGPKGHFFEVTPEGETVWEYYSPYRGSIHRMNGDPGNPMNMTYSTFRANFIAADHPGLQGRELKPLDPQPEVFVLPPKENKAMQ